MASRETLVTQTFVQLADSLVDDFDVIDLLTMLVDRAVDLLDAAAAGILLVDARGGLRVMAATSEEVRLLELFQLQNSEGPCLECCRSGQAVVNGDLANSPQWPLFSREAVEAGFRSVQALPLRLRDQVIGALNVFLDDRVILADADVALGQALADVATIAILQNQATREAGLVTAQLQGALNSRVSIEQAKGVLAERAQVNMDEAFSWLRRYARDHNQRLSLVAAALVDGSLTLAEIARVSKPGRPSGRPDRARPGTN